MTNRRQFLETTTAVLTSWFIPKSLFANQPKTSFFFIRIDSYNSWSVADPVAWSLQNTNNPILERASEGLAKLTAVDGDRIIRLVVRRCGLNLIERHQNQVVVHHWGIHQADLRPWFKAQRVARPDITVALRDRKKEFVTGKTGDQFLYGDPIGSGFPLTLFENKWKRRFEQAVDDWQAAPGTRSGFAWDGVKDGSIPWAAMKSAWKRDAGFVCLNCDQPTLVANFGLRPVGLLNRTPNFVYVCGKCQRLFRDETVKDVAGWMMANLDTDVRPDFEMFWDRRVRLKTLTRETIS